MTQMVKSYRNTVIKALQPAWNASSPHGVFADACNVHVESSVSWERVFVDGQLMAHSAARWYFNHSVEKHLDEQHELQLVVQNDTIIGFNSTNPTCCPQQLHGQCLN